MKLPKRINVRSVALALGLAVWTLTISGCVVAVGNEGVRPYRPTLGQELTDLKKARDNGSISEDEYQAQRQKLLDERGKKLN